MVQKGPMILLLDDSHQVLQALKKYCHKRFPETTVLGAHNVRRAEILYAEMRKWIFLILIDRHLEKGESGVEFVQWLKGLDDRHFFGNLVALTDCTLEMREAGCDIFLPKPFDVSTLHTVILVSLNKFKNAARSAK